ncbi:TPA: hypothetical protein NU565_004787, partial [Escherichia coli]|nr:hypothetical protein [Escherichia coli]
MRFLYTVVVLDGKENNIVDILPLIGDATALFIPNLNGAADVMGVLVTSSSKYPSSVAPINTDPFIDAPPFNAIIWTHAPNPFLYLIVVASADEEPLNAI